MAGASSTTGVVQVLTQLKDVWGRQPRARRLLAVGVLVGVLGLIGWTTFAHHGETWAAFGEGASPDDVQELLSALQGRNLPARLREGKLEVLSGDLEQARAIAASVGLPRTGKGFELFDASSLGQSSFTEQVNYRRALQGELARSIAAMAQIEGARVQIALGKRSMFKDQDQLASASVALHLHPGQTLTGEQVRGVRQLVAASVEGLKPDAVVVVDSHGNLLDVSEPGAADRKLEIERAVTGRVRSTLERLVGRGKVAVTTTADLDERKVSETEELYDNAKNALRSETRSVEGADATAGIGGVAGTRGNLPGAPAASPTPGAGSGQHLQETRNYEISRTVRQTTKPDVQLLRLHVAVVLDDKSGPDGKPVPRSEKEVAELAAVARQAAGIDDARGDKIEVHSIAFAADPDVTTTPDAATATSLPLVPIAIGGGVVVLIALGGIVLAMRRTRRKAARTTLALPAPVGELERALDARTSTGELPPPTDLPGLPAGRPVRDRVLETVRADVERAANVLTAWLSEPPRKGVKP